MQIKSKQISLAQGSVILGDANGNGSALPIGANGEVLTSNGTTASWQPISITGAFVYQGTVDASLSLATQVPSPSQGDYYRVTAIGGTNDFVGETSFTVQVGDSIVYNGTGWDKIDNTDPTLQGTTNRIAITGSGNAGDPYVVDIDSGYIGQASITTVGTIGTGTWQGDEITISYGGTGRTTLAQHGVLVGPASGQVMDEVVIADGTLLGRNGGGVTSLAGSDIREIAQSRVGNDTATATGGANESFTGFFTNTPVADSTISVFFNGLELDTGGWTRSGNNLTLVDSVNGYSTDSGDVIRARYEY